MNQTEKETYIKDTTPQEPSVIVVKISCIPEQIPKELTQRPQWVVHNRKKVPFHPTTGTGAKAGDPSTWSNFQNAIQAYQENPLRYSGVGFELNNNGLVGIDLDTVRDPFTGEVDPIAARIIQELNSYTEISPSGYGFHIFCNADVKLSWNKCQLPNNEIVRPALDADTGQPCIDKDGNPIFKKPEIEMYTHSRYFTITGNVVFGYNTIQNRKNQVINLQSSFRKVETASSQKNATSDFRGDKDYLKIGFEKDPTFLKLWEGNRPCGNESSDDFALMSKLAYWCNCNTERMLELFLESPHCLQKDPKHQKKVMRPDYLVRTANRAILHCTKHAAAKDQEYKETHLKQGHKASNRLPGMEIFTPDELVPELLRFELNDIGNAERLLFFYQDIIRFNPELGIWYIWNQKKWEQDITGKIFRLGILTAKTYQATADQHLKEEAGKEEHSAPSYKQSKTVAKHAKDTGCLNKLTAMIQIAGQAAYIEQNILDRHKHLLTCANGTVDLRSGKLLPFDPMHYITKVVNVNYQQDATAPIFMSFLNRIFDGDNALITYIQKVLGYCTTGETKEQCFFIGYGTGANGKSTLIDTMRHILEDHSQTIPTHILMDNDRRSSATPELARAKGARLVIASESKDMHSLNEEQIKQLTGEDDLSVRPLYSQGFEFKPNFKIWLSTNHKPTIRGTDNGIWRRIHFIPFKVTIPEEECDRDLPQKLLNEKEGIFAWLVQGAQLYYTDGLKKPDAVTEATEEYRSEMDVLGNFIEDCIVVAEGEAILTKRLYDIYRWYCEENDQPILSQNIFGRRLSEKGFIRKKISTIFYMNIKLSEVGIGIFQKKSPEIA